MTDEKEPIVPFSTTSGLTKREYFAGLMLQGLLAGQAYTHQHVLSIEAIMYADSLIEELNK